MDQGVVGVKHVIGCLIAFAVLLAPARVLAGGYGSYSQLTGFISSLIRGIGGVGREMIRPPAPPPLRGPDPIFGLVESPKRLWRYAQQGFGRQVLEGLRRGRYRDLAGRFLRGHDQVFAVFLLMPVDVFHHDDGVIHHDA